MTQPDPIAETPAVPKHLSVREIAADIAADLRTASAGDLAELRRGAPHSSVFWRLFLRHVEGAGRGRGPEEQATWVVAIAVLATGLRASGYGKPATGTLHTGRPLGRALAAAGFSETRLTRLLRARDRHLMDEVERAGRMLAAKGEAADLIELVELLFTTPDRTERTRLTIARSYYSKKSSPKGD